ncbi:hypothetical protein ACFFV7_38915 [Nonomuraea spiralis]|uniref:Uncharacterized protein n=1 Tax=Nonomuraea spiralis TaxID=46182 RepID=A0ABV5IRN1_9ACTN|nr:hypothetical protein [Nonomuraea spiralis]
MYEIVSALMPPAVVGGAFIVGVVHLVRAEGRAKAAEARPRTAPVEEQADGPS